jgi:hypothetical protein
MDVDNKLGDETVTLLPDPSSVYLSGTYNNYNSIFETITNGWLVNTRPLLAEDILKVISTDVNNSFLIRNNISNLIIGDLNYGDRMSTETSKAISYNGYYKFIDEKYKYFSATNCYWTSSEYGGNSGFAVKMIDGINSKLYDEAKTTSCNVVPVILANKANL